MCITEAHVHSLLPYPVCSTGLGWFGFLGLAWRTIVFSSVFSYRVCHSFSVIFSPQPFGIETRCICAVPLLFSIEATPLVIPFSLIVLSTVYMLIIPIFLYLVLTFGYRIISNFSFHISTRYLKLSQT